MTPEQREELKRAALAASPGPWKGDRYDGTVKYELLDANDNAVIKGDNGNSGDGGYGITNYEDEVYLKAANPEAILSLIAQVEALAVPQGYRIVPIEPTPEMYDAAGASLYGYSRANAIEWAKEDKFESQADSGCDAYRAMLDAAPTIPAIPGTKEGA